MAYFFVHVGLILSAVHAHTLPYGAPRRETLNALFLVQYFKIPLTELFGIGKKGDIIKFHTCAFQTQYFDKILQLNG